MKRVILLALVLAWLFTGCGALLDGSYVSVQPHPTQSQAVAETGIVVTNSTTVYTALVDLVHRNVKSGRLSASGYDGEKLRYDLETAIRWVMRTDAVAAYAVESIRYEIGTRTVTVDITYRQGRADLDQIRKVDGMEQAKSHIHDALDRCDASLVLQVDNYLDTDFALLVHTYALENPHKVMEQPRVTVNTYPEQGKERVVELVFTYQNNRDDLRAMQGYVAPVFQASRLNVIGEESESVRFALMYSFLAERNAISVGTSITPAYSLLRYGVGDSRAFALVFAAMCRNAQLECLVVTGTWEGQPHFWNMICQDGKYYHVDILRDIASQTLPRYTDQEMVDYVWDYEKYPACQG